jgi:hypothetical protein
MFNYNLQYYLLNDSSLCRTFGDGRALGLLYLDLISTCLRTMFWVKMSWFDASLDCAFLLMRRACKQSFMCYQAAESQSPKGGRPCSHRWSATLIFSSYLVGVGVIKESSGYGHRFHRSGNIVDPLYGIWAKEFPSANNVSVISHNHLVRFDWQMML